MLGDKDDSPTVVDAPHSTKTLNSFFNSSFSISAAFKRAMCFFVLSWYVLVLFFDGSNKFISFLNLFCFCYSHS